jgi:hypothetical protein
MANDLQTTDQAALSIQWSQPQLPQRLASLVSDRLPAEYAPLDDGEVIAVQQALADHTAYPKGSTERQINKMMAKLSLAYPNSKLSMEEAGARLELYCDMLGDINLDVLAAGFRRAVQTCKFFPSVSELRELAMTAPATPRMSQRWRLNELLNRHRSQAAQIAEPYATPEQIAAIKIELGVDNSALLNRVVGSEAA